MSPLNEGLGNGKWNSVFLYSFLLPIVVIATVTIFLGFDSKNFGLLLFQVVLDGQLGLISTLLILATVLALWETRQAHDGFQLIQIWPLIVFPLLIIYGLDKDCFMTWSQSICTNPGQIGMKEWAYAMTNLVEVVACPYYCSRCFHSASIAGVQRVL